MNQPSASGRSEIFFLFAFLHQSLSVSMLCQRVKTEAHAGTSFATLALHYMSKDIKTSLKKPNLDPDIILGKK